MKEYKKKFDEKLMMLFFKGNSVWNDAENQMEIETDNYNEGQTNAIMYDYYEDHFSYNNMILD